MPVIYVLAISVLLQFYAGYLALRLIPLTGRRAAWLCIASAIFLMGVRRSITLFPLVRNQPSVGPDLATEFVALFISLLMVFGIARLAPLFKSRQVFERDLVESEGRFRELLENCGGTAYKLLFETNRYEYVSPSVVAQLGYTPEEMMGYTGFEFIETFVHPDDRDRILEEIRRLIRQDEPYSSARVMEYQIRHKNGEYRWFEDRLTVLRDPSGKALAVVGNSRNVTDRKKSEAALHESEARFQSVLHSIEDAVWASKLDPPQTIFINPAAERIYGRPLEEFFESPDLWFEHIHSDDKPVVEALRKTLRERGQVQMEFRVVRPDGEIRWVFARVNLVMNEKGEPDRVAGIATDVTVRREAEEALRESESRYRTLVEHASDAITIHSADGTFEDVNAMACTITGCSRDELTGANAREFTPKEDYANHLMYAERALAGENLVVEGTLKRKDGSTTPIEVSLTRLPDGRLLAVWRDITQRKKAEKALRASARMEATATLAGGVAHDFNNLMVAVLCNASFLKTDLGEDHPDYPLLQEIEAAAEKAGDLARQVLAFGRGGKYRPVAISINAITEDVLRLQQRSFSREIHVETCFDEELWSVHADPTQMSQVIMNLCQNAAESIDGSGNILVKTQNVEVNTAFQNEKLPMDHGKYVCVSVTDTGSGMDRPTLEQAFEPYFSKKEHGRGLGLAATYGIVKNHQGYIFGESAEGKGTTFRVYLPATDVRVYVAGHDAKVDAQGSETILIVDDEAQVARALKLLLSRLGYHCLVAENGKEAVEIARSYSGDIHLALLDLAMPVMDGPEAFPLLRNVRPEMRIIVCSGYQPDGDGQSLLDQGADAFLQKPFSPTTIGEKIRSILDAPLPLR